VIAIYNKYKSTDFDLMDEIPHNWNSTKIKHIATVYNGDSLNDELKEQFSLNKEGLSYIASKDIDLNTGAIDYNNGMIIPDSLGNFKIAPMNSTLLCIEGGSAGRKIAFTNQNVCFVNKLACFLSEDYYTSKFLFYYLKSHVFQNQFRRSLTGLIGGVSISNINNFIIPLPSINEREIIAKFLDCKVNIIDQLISKKEKLIRSLIEKRQAIINEAVTKGINPNSRLKDSGVEWLGMIPEEWDLANLRYLGSFQNGISQSGDYFGSGDTFLSYGDVYKNERLPELVSGLALSNKTEKEHYSVREGDVFFTRTSETIEEIGIASTCFKTIENAVFSGFLIRMRPFENKLYKGFSKYYFRSFVPRIHFTKEMNLVTRASLSQELLKSLPVCLPPLEVQKEIASYLDKKTSIVDSALAKIESSIEKLKEYRQSLISEAVTGKIDVRNWKSEIQNN